MNKQEQIRQYLEQTFEALAKINPNLANTERRQRANEMFLNAETDFDIVREKIDTASQELLDSYQEQLRKQELYKKMREQGYYQNIEKESVLTNQSEELMLKTLEANMNSEFTRKLLKQNWESSRSTGALAHLIGEIYLHHILHKDGFEYENYMNRMSELYFKFATKQLAKEDFDRERARIIAGGIALKLGIDPQQVSNDDSEQIKKYFINEYVTNGYVSHSFPEAYRESIMMNGLIPNTSDRGHSLDATEEIQKIFMKKGVVAPLGGFPFYSGSGVYFEHDFTKVFLHAIHSPEWFKWFTSSDHLKSSPDITKTPYILRDEEACKRNVMDLCSNTGLSEKESNFVMQFYQENYEKLESPTLNVGLISKKTVNKETVEIPSDLSLLDTITFVLNDNANQYVEHKGNVANERITPDKIKLTHIPNVTTFMHVDSYQRETMEHLLDPDENLRILSNAEDNLTRMTPEMAQIVRDTKNQIMESKKNIFLDSQENFSPETQALIDQPIQNNEDIQVKYYEEVGAQEQQLQTQNSQEQSQSFGQTTGFGRTGQMSNPTNSAPTMSSGGRGR